MTNQSQKNIATTGTCCCSSPAAAQVEIKDNRAWTLRYLAVAGLAALLWGLAYWHIEPLANWLVYHLFDFSKDSHLGSALEFFLYDTAKILLLLFLMIYVIAWFRASLHLEHIRAYLAGKRRIFGYGIGALLGSITPFCSCSSVPIFLGFTTARISIGISMAFLITSPLINEIAIVLLWGLLGWKFTIIYVSVGIFAGIIGGWLMDTIKAGRWLQPYLLDMQKKTIALSMNQGDMTAPSLSIRQRHAFATEETSTICKRIWKWVVLGVGIGAVLHGYIPANWFAEHFSAGQWWTVPAAVFVAIPLYSNVTGIIPVMEVLLLKGLPLGTTIAFCMSSVAASIPEMLMLRQIMTIKLQAAFLAYLWLMFTLIGWLFNIF